MADLGNFNAEEHKDNEFGALPDGDYVAMAIESEYKPTKKGDGRYLQITWQVADGDFAGRYLWSRLNLENPNEKAVQIAKGELAAICRAVDVLQPRDSSELHSKPLVLSVGCEDYNGKTQNRIKRYKAANGSGSTAKAVAAASKTQKAPWE